MDYHIGRYGRMRQDYYMLLTEILWKHLAEIDKECRTNCVCSEMMYRLVKRMAEREGVTEKLISDDWLCQFQKMNSIRNRAVAFLLSFKIGDFAFFVFILRSRLRHTLGRAN